MRFESIERQKLFRKPYSWALVDGLFSPQHAADLATTFPRDHFKIVKGYDSEKDYAYHARALVGMGSKAISHVEQLSPAWRQLATDLLSNRYRAALSRLTGIDLSKLRMEANVFHYGSGAWLGPHVDLADKIATHVLYFNPSWDVANGGCLNVLRSSDMQDSACVIAPIVGSSAVLVRSDKSWHAVSRVDPSCVESRRSVTVTFYRDSAVSTMWPPDDNAPTFDYGEAGCSR
jgi:Rps23 Pro-64 3,4-dihydroxylase Tpa1-like proline 4-hydroxylase